MTLNFVHVGKCAGTSIETALQQMEIEYEGYHCFDANVRLKARLDSSNDDFYLVTVRDPIKRFISAFYWDLYEKRIINDEVGPKGSWKSIFEAFATPNDLAESLSSSDRVLADLANHAVKESFLHMHLTLSWYLSVDLAKRLTSSNAFVVRAEHADSDFAGFTKTVLGRTFTGQLMREKSDYKNEISAYSTCLSDRAVMNLKKIYRDDYEVLALFSSNGLNSYESRD